MSVSHRRLGAAVLGLVALTFTTLATSAQAAPYVNAASIALGSQVACTTDTVSGAGFAPGAVALTLQPAPVSLGSATADASGNFSKTVTLPSGTDGAHTIVATQGSVTASSAVTVDCSGSGAGGAGISTGGGGGLSSTGVAVLGIGSLGLILLLGGGVLLVAGRRRRAIG
jgi:hypothetical protein